MLSISLSELLKVAGGKLWNDAKASQTRARGVSIDSRTLKNGNLFVAIPGERFDGHQFVWEATNKGASLVIISKEKMNQVKEKELGEIPVVLVEDTKKALRDIAFWHRNKFEIPAVAITGTNGKTTTKDMIAEVLSSKFRVLKSIKSYNNLIGVPLTLFELEKDTQVLVLELGMSNPKEIGILTRTAIPNIGVITNIGPAHLESMQSLEKIAQAKFELLDNMPSPHTSVLNADDEFLAERIKNSREKTISFAIKNEADFKASELTISDEGYIGFKVNDKLNINLKLIGEHNVYNALAAFAVGTLLGVEEEKIKRCLEKYKPSELRMELVRFASIKVINDSYNANPVSMANALKTLRQMKNEGRKIAVLGDMLELGEKTLDYHFELGRSVAESGIDLLLTVGKHSPTIGQGAQEYGMSPEEIFAFDNNQKVSSYLLENLKVGDLVLIKGSRKMKLEEVVLSLKSLYGRQN
ncbi:MAG: UDP-N-acetylmuramoyl-tripeptide--D-alanyl-D-alanine ligase [candidate division Zixibacteria bacterium]|nr:UDP-N-acetylmuramoyl-tripeptide--D-alanyl-D-alanine ligase [candidate division Zixibacteria bacterium]